MRHKQWANGVAFAIKDLPVIGYPAGSKQIIKFQFTANATPIRDGYVRVRLPSGWTQPNPTLKDATARLPILKRQPWLMVRLRSASASPTCTFETKALTISGNIITVHVDRLKQTGTIDDYIRCYRNRR